MGIIHGEKGASFNSPAHLKRKAIEGLEALELVLANFEGRVANIREEVTRPILDRPMSVAEAARYLDLSIRSVYRAVSEGQLIAGRKSRNPKSPYTFKQEDLDDYNRRRASGFKY